MGGGESVALRSKRADAARRAGAREETRLPGRDELSEAQGTGLASADQGARDALSAPEREDQVGDGVKVLTG